MELQLLKDLHPRQLSPENSQQSPNIALSSSSAVICQLSPNKSPIAKKKQEFHTQIRIRDKHKKMAQKRFQFATEQNLSSLLNSNIPRQKQQILEWAQKTLGFLKDINNQQFQLDKDELRLIFSMTQRHPCWSTLFLLKESIDLSSTLAVEMLFDLDAFSVAHNAIKFPTRYQNIGKGSLRGEKLEEDLTLQGLQKIEEEMVKLGISLLCKLYIKSPKLRSFSIGTHQTFKSYVQPASNLYRYSIKTQVTAFLNAAFCTPIKQYHKNFLDVIKYAFFFLQQYNSNLRKFIDGYYFYYSESSENQYMERPSWQDCSPNETINEVELRLCQLMGCLEECIKQQKRWILDYIDKYIDELDIGLYELIWRSLVFCKLMIRTWISDSLKMGRKNSTDCAQSSMNESQGSSSPSPLRNLENQNFGILKGALSLIYSSLKLFGFYSQKMATDGSKYCEKVPHIIYLSMEILHLLRVLNEYEFLNAYEKTILSAFNTQTGSLHSSFNSEDESYESALTSVQSFSISMQKCRMIIYHTVTQAMGSNFDNYDNFAKRFITPTLHQSHHKSDIEKLLSIDSNTAITTNYDINIFVEVTYWFKHGPKNEGLLSELLECTRELFTSAVVNYEALDPSVSEQIFKDIFQIIKDQFIPTITKCLACGVIEELIKLKSKIKDDLGCDSCLREEFFRFRDYYTALEHDEGLNSGYLRGYEIEKKHLASSIENLLDIGEKVYVANQEIDGSEM